MVRFQNIHNGKIPETRLQKNKKNNYEKKCNCDAYRIFIRSS